MVQAAKSGLRDLEAGPGRHRNAGPGKLGVLPAAPRLRPDALADRFPVGAAVGKTDGALTEAIDRAGDDLDRSGRLARAFARWHIPYYPADQPDLDPERSPVCGPSVRRDYRRLRRRALLGATLLAPGPWPWSLPDRRLADRSTGARTAVRPGPAAPAEGQALFAACAAAATAAPPAAARSPTWPTTRGSTAAPTPTSRATIKNGVPGTTMKKLGDALKADQIRR